MLVRHKRTHNLGKRWSAIDLPRASLAVMSEATYNGDKEGGEPSAPSGSGQQGGNGGGGGSHALGPLTVDTTYARSIEGILKMITVVSQLTSW